MAVTATDDGFALTGTVGDMWFDDCFSSGDVILALAHHGNDKDVTIRLNSSGGIATEGSAIHSALMNHKGKKTAVVEGIAASAASIVAMAGDEIVMSAGALMMIHDPAGVTVGTAADHQIQLSALNAIGDAMAGIYADRTGKTTKQARADMKQELWMTGEQAVKEGYATSVKQRTAATPPPEVTAFDFRLYHHAPQHLVALASAKDWTKRTPREAVAVTAKAAAREKEDNMPLTQEMKDEIAATVATAITAALPKAPPAPGAPPAPTGNIAADIAVACNEAKVPELTATLLREGVTIDEARDRIAMLGEANRIAATARKKLPDLPDNFGITALAKCQKLADIRAELFDKMAAADDATAVNSHTGMPVDKGGKADQKAASEQAKASMQAELKRMGLATAA